MRWIVGAFVGVKVGSLTISLGQILTAIAVLLLFLGATRFVQHSLQRKIFPQTRIDQGVQNSLNTIIGYTGVVLALAAAITALGVSFSNLAIIAGALSVGIGFGLQSVVNNFVSGLILLFERPIKVGDWVVTASGEGHVKRISVRSTEIETFDRASIILPNSELISSSVQNWTLKDRHGRLRLAVGVSYESDPDHVRKTLLKVAADQYPRILSYPEPYVYFRDFGNSSLDFELRVFVRDVSNWITVSSDLRFAIFRAFKEEGIEIPFPQRDLHLRSGFDLVPLGGGEPIQG
jgi:small-conductance mechanosensitive channel